MIYWELFLGFLKVGCFSFGGAYGAIPLIQDVAMRYGWLDEETLTYMIAVGESTPGPIMVNLATYVGLSQGGMAGAIIATLAVVLPAFLIILLLMVALKKVWNYPGVQAVLDSVRPCVTGIILAVGAEMIFQKCFSVMPDFQMDIRAFFVTVFLGVLWFGWKYGRKKKISPITLILFSAMLGIVVWGV